jgi:predicted RNase H-like nuclease (RuvC/YqgF family)
MNEELIHQLTSTSERLATAAEALDRVLGRLDAQQEALNAKVDHIIAAVEEKLASPATSATPELEQRIAELKKANADLKAQAGRLARKTVSPLVSTLLNKYSEAEASLDAPALDKILQSLTVEQRIAVKAEMARAGMLE